MALADQLAQGVQFAAPIDPFAQYGKMQQLQAGQTQNALAQYQLGQAQRTDQEANALRQSLPADFDPTNPSHVNALLRASPVGGAALVEKLAKVRTENLAGQKTQSDIDTAKLKQQQDIAKIGGSILYGVNDQASYDKAVDALKRIGGPDSVKDYPPQFDPNFVQTEIRKGQDLEKELDRMKPIPMRAGGSLWNPKTQQFEATAPIEPTPLLPKDVEAQKIRIAQASRAPVQPTAPVAVIDPGTGKTVYVDRATAISGKMTPAASMEGLSPKEIQKREAAYPQATSAVKSIEDNTDNLIKDLQTLRDSPGLDQITGIAAGRLPALTAQGRAAQATYDRVVAQGGFQVLQDMRNASKTGGALGNISDKEGAQLKSAFAAIDRKQDAGDVRKAIDDAIANAQGSKARFREAYDATYDYKNNAPAVAPRVVAPAANIDALLNKYAPK